MRVVFVGMALVLSACASPKAADGGRHGFVVVEIVVGHDGALARADVVDEEPKGFGFGAAVISAVQKFSWEDAPRGRSRITVRFIRESDGALSSMVIDEGTPHSTSESP